MRRMDVSPDSQSGLGGRHSLRKRVRSAAQRLLYPIDRLSYELYAALPRSRVTAQALEPGKEIRRILILSPHHDDELLGCGGFMIKHGGERSIHVAYVTDGIGGSQRSAAARRALAEQRMAEAREVSRALHLNEPIFLSFADGSLRDEAQLPAALAALITRLEPDMIMTPFITDGHRDHAATSVALASLGASFLQAVQICLYQVHSHIPDQALNRFVELSRQEHAAKQKVLRLYTSQNMTRDLTLSKYLMFSEIAPQIARRAGIVSIEHFALLSGARFCALAALWNVDALVARIKTTNYSPYSFRHFLHNKRLLDSQVMPPP